MCLLLDLESHRDFSQCCCPLLALHACNTEGISLCVLAPLPVVDCCYWCLVQVLWILCSLSLASVLGSCVPELQEWSFFSFFDSSPVTTPTSHSEQVLKRRQTSCPLPHGTQTLSCIDVWVGVSWVWVRFLSFLQKPSVLYQCKILGFLLLASGRWLLLSVSAGLGVGGFFIFSILWVSPSEVADLCLVAGQGPVG